MKQKIEDIFFDIEIIAFELFALDTRFYLERILVIRGQYVEKQFQDLRYNQNKTFLADFLPE